MWLGAVGLLVLTACTIRTPLVDDSTATTAATQDSDSAKISVQGFQYTFQCNRATLTADFAERDALPQARIPETNWYARDADGDYINGGWGPRPNAYPKVVVPANASCDAATWQRERILAVALRYRNVPDNPLALDYRHHHIPAWNPPTNTHSSGNNGNPEMNGLGAWDAGTGLDCSNFTSWVYNFGLGIQFTSSVRELYSKSLGIPAQPLPKQGPFQLGDLIYLHPTNSTDYASHVVIYLDDGHVIDARYDYTGPDGKVMRGVQIRPREGWYRRAVLGGWRIIAP